jgi:hypothetical protein
LAAAVGLFSAAAATAAAVKAAAVAATAAPAGAVPLTGLERRFCFSTQAALLRFSCARLRAFARRFRLGASKMVGDGWKEKSKLWLPPRVSRTTFAQLREATHAIYSCSTLAAVGSRGGTAVRLVADPRQVEPCVGPDISTPPQRGGGEGVAGGNIEHLSVRELAVHRILSVI